MKYFYCIPFLMAALTLSTVWAESQSSGSNGLGAVTVPRAAEDASTVGGSAESMLNRRKPIRDVSSKKARVRARGSCVDGDGKRYKAGQDGYSTCLEQAESGSSVAPAVRAHGQEGTTSAKIHF